MTGIATRSDLVSRITAFLFNRSDIASTDMDTWIQLAEAEMQRRLPTRLRTGLNAAFAIATEYVNTPADFAGVISFELESDPVRRLVAKTPDQLVDLRAGHTDLTGIPFCYSIIGSQFRFWRAPDQAYTASLVYWQRFAALVNAADTNWVLANHPDAYFYGVLAHGAGWLDEDERAGGWATAFEAILTSIVEADKNEQPGGSLQLTPSNVFGWNSRA